MATCVKCNEKFDEDVSGMLHNDMACSAALIKQRDAAEKRAVEAEASRDTWMKLHRTLDASFVDATAKLDEAQGRHARINAAYEIASALAEKERERAEDLQALLDRSFNTSYRGLLRDVQAAEKRDVEAERYLLADEERRKLTGDALHAEGQLVAVAAKLAEAERLEHARCVKLLRTRRDKDVGSASEWAEWLDERAPR